jgi:hypothetical protein
MIALKDITKSGKNGPEIRKKGKNKNGIIIRLSEK